METPVEIETPFGSFTIYPTGNVVAETKSAIVAIGQNGNSQVTFKLPVAQLELTNILEVASHSINVSGNETTHRVEFLDGGHFTFSYDKDGILSSLIGSQVNIGFTNAGTLTVGPWATNPMQVGTQTTD